MPSFGSGYRGDMTPPEKKQTQVMSKLAFVRARTLIHVRIETETERRPIATLSLKDEAYARLFVASEDLLAALKGVTYAGGYIGIDAHPRGCWSVKVPDEMAPLAAMWVEKRNAAIARAEGRS